jgi:Ca2+-binding EF-hand superfamily protein
MVRKGLCPLEARMKSRVRYSLGAQPGVTKRHANEILGRNNVLRTLIVAAATAALAFPGAALAQQQAPQPVTKAKLNADLDTAFKGVDTNHDGFISAAELAAQQNKELAALQAQARAKLQEDFKQLDTNKDGQLSFAEFSAVATVKPSQTAAQILQSMDTNHDGKISAAEFKAQRLAIFDKVDTNHDGTVSVEEMRAAAGSR